MRTVKSLIRIDFIGCLFLVVLANSVLAQTVLDFRPIPPGPGSRTTAGIVNGNRIEVTPGNIVQLDMFVSGWGDAGMGAMEALDATIDGNSYCTGDGAPLSPLGYPTAPITSCPHGNGCSIDGDTCSDGAYISRQRCTIGIAMPPTGGVCLSSSDCPGGFCVANPDFISPLFDIAVIGFTNRRLNYEYSLATIDFGGFVDLGNEGYFATLLVEVPQNAMGLYVFSFGGNTSWTGVIGNLGFPDIPFDTILFAEILVVEENNDADGDGVIDSEDLCLGADDAVFGDCTNSIPTTSSWGILVLCLSLLVGVKLYTLCRVGQAIA